jgi:hypothetical protein
MSAKYSTEQKPIEDKGLVAGERMWTFKEIEPYKLYTPPPVVGWWILPGSSGSSAVKIACYTKPRWVNIKMMKYILGFGYEDVK